MISHCFLANQLLTRRALEWAGSGHLAGTGQAAERGIVGLTAETSSADDRVAFLNGTFEEALKLACETRDYMAYQEPKDRAKLSPRARMVASCESMRVTTRLTQVIAWLLVQKAVQAGEISRREAADEKFRLAAHEVCARPDPVEDQPLPPRLSELMRLSLGLYQRVARLDAMMDR